MAALTLIPSQTAAVTVVVFHSLTEQDVPATVLAIGLAGAESVPVRVSVDDGGTSEAASQGGTAVTLTATDNILAVNTPMTIGVTKPTTAGAAGVFIAKRAKV